MTETKAIYKIRINTKNKQTAENILEQIDEMLIWLEHIFPSMEVEIGNMASS